MPASSRPDPAMPHLTTLRLAYGDERRARVVERSLAQEVGEIDDDRSTTRLGRDGRAVELSIAAADLVALRAAANTWLSLAGVAERVAATVDDGAPDARRSGTGDHDGPENR